MSSEQRSILRHLIHVALDTLFASDQQKMASALGCTAAELDTALTVDGARKSADIFNKLSHYCIEHALSMDELLAGYDKE